MDVMQRLDLPATDSQKRSYSRNGSALLRYNAAVRLLAGDVGGTKTILRLVENARIVSERRYESEAYATFEDVVTDFLGHDRSQRIDAGCIAVAGPVIANRSDLTNLRWVIEGQALEHQFSIAQVDLINDFHAIGLGVPLLKPVDLLSLNEGVRRRGEPVAILGAGTGLGESFVTFAGDLWTVVASEGGHADFAPQDARQAELFLALHEKFGHVSWERLLSGAGLARIYSFLGREEVEPAEVASRADSGDAGAKEAAGMFVDIYGAEAGNMALRILARGGVFLAGGIAAKNQGWFTDGRFLEAFLRKGRFRPLLAETPVDLIVNEKVGLIGAVEMARRTAVSRLTSHS